MACRITARKTASRELDDRFDVRVWASISPGEGFAEAWRLSEEICRLKGWDPGEPGLVKNKQALARAEDLLDLDLLRRHHPG